MIKTIKDLLESYNIPVPEDVPETLLNYVINEEGMESYGDYHTEKQGDRTVHVFSTLNDVPDIAYPLKIENILDLDKESATWSEIRTWEGSGERSAGVSKTIYADGTVIDGMT